MFLGVPLIEHLTITLPINALNMNFKTTLALATLLAASQASALTAYERHMGCTNEGAGCGAGASNGGGVGSGSGNASYDNAFISEGSLWEGFSDKDGFFYIETNMSTGKKSVHVHDKAAMLIKPPPAKENMRRDALVHGPMAPAMTAEQAKQKAAENAAKAAGAAAAGAAAQAAGQKAAADAAANKATQQALANPPGMVVTAAQPVGMASPSTARKKP